MLSFDNIINEKSLIQLMKKVNKANSNWSCTILICYFNKHYIVTHHIVFFSWWLCPWHYKKSFDYNLFLMILQSIVIHFQLFHFSGPVSPEDLVMLYEESCHKHGTAPIEQVVDQLKVSQWKMYHSVTESKNYWINAYFFIFRYVTSLIQI